MLDTIFLTELHYSGANIYTYQVSSFSAYFDKIPPMLHVMLAFVSSIYAIFAFTKTYLTLKNQITDLSIKEAIETLPTGLAFLAKNGDIFLSNQILHNLSLALTQKDLQNGNEFWNDLETLTKANNCVLLSDTPAFLLQDGEVWQFSKEHIIINHSDYFKITATNISDIYHISKTTEGLNVRLQEQQTRLKTLIDDIEKNAIAQVTLNMKVNFHDSFGNLIAETYKGYKENKAENLTENIRKWQDLDRVITDLSKLDSPNLSMEQISIFAQNLGCNLRVSSTTSSAALDHKLILIAINEMLKNAVYHENASQLTVKVSENKVAYQAEIWNANTKGIHEIKEGNGLSSLRDKIEKSGGSMEITALTNIVLKILIPKNN